MKKLFTLLLLLVCVVSTSWAQKIYTVSYDGKDVASEEGYFTNSAKHNFNTKFCPCTYEDHTYAKALKMESATTVTFTTTNNATVTIVQSLVSGGDKTIKLNGDVLDGRVNDTIGHVGVYTKTNLSAGTYTVARGSGESGICYIKVVEQAAENQVAIPTISSADGKFTFTDNATISISTATAGATIHYTINDGDEQVYSNPFTINSKSTIKAWATKDGMSKSSTATATFSKVLNNPVLTLNGNILTPGNIEGLSCNENLIATADEGQFIISAWSTDPNKYTTAEGLNGSNKSETNTTNLLTPTGGDQRVLFIAATDGNGNYSGLCVYVFKNVNTVLTSITDAGYASFSDANNNLDFSQMDGLTAYVATGNTTSTITLEEVTSIPASTGVILKGAKGEYRIPIVISASEPVVNILKATTKETTFKAGEVYAFGVLNGTVGFYVVGEGGYTVKKNRAYIDATSITADAKPFLTFDNNGTNNISFEEAASFDKNAPMYNLAGQRVNANYHGVVLQNGKKFIVK